MTPVALVILALLQVATTPFGPVFAGHLERHVYGPELRAEQLAEQYELAAALTGVRVERLIAKDKGESNLNHAARGPVVRGRRALGISQLYPSNPYYAAWRFDCMRDPYACEQSAVIHGARALRDSLRACGGAFAEAVGHYRGVGCRARPKDKAVALNARTIAWRLAHPSARRIQLAEVASR